MRLQAGGIVIREWGEADIAALPPIADNPRIASTLHPRFPTPYTHDDAAQWVRYCASSPGNLDRALEIDGTLAGGIGLILRPPPFEHSAEIGYWLAEPFWGRGIATAAVALVSDHAFQTLGLGRLEAPVFSWNLASMRVLEKNGFEREGLMRRSMQKDGRLVDRVLFARLACPT
ncbi:MAG: GNAT family protein [Rhodocyclaceae bacterium]